MMRTLNLSDCSRNPETQHASQVPDRRKRRTDKTVRFFVPAQVFPALFFLLAILPALFLTGCTPKNGSVLHVQELEELERFHGKNTSTTDRGTIENRASAPSFISLSPGISEMLFFVDAGPRVLANTTFCNYPPEAAAKEKIGGMTGETISIEKILQLDPDYVIGQADMHEKIAERLAEAGVDSILLDTSSIRNISENCRILAALSGTGTKETKIQELAAILQGPERIPDPPMKALWIIWNDPLMAAGKNSFPGSALTHLGLQNILENAEADYPLVSPERIFSQQPDIIFLYDKPSFRELKTTLGKGFPDDGPRFVFLDEKRFSIPGPRFLYSIEKIASLLYPPTGS